MEKKNEKEVIIKISGKEWEKYLDDAFKKANKNAKIAGFRPGKAPKDIFIKHYGMESLLYEASNKAIEAAYDKMIEENKDLEIVAQPMVDITKVDEKEIEYKFVLTLKPEVKLGKYTGLKAKKEAVKVTKEEVDNSVKEMQNRYKENVLKDGKIANGDVAVIDFEGFKDGKAFDGGKGENYSLEIGSNTFIPGFEEQLIGHKADDEVEVKVTFPSDYHAEELKGKPVVFKVTIHEVKEVKVPELDKDFFEDLGMEGINDEESLRKQLEENIKVRKDHEAEEKWLDELLKEASSTMEVEIPEAMVHEEIHHMIDEYSRNLQMQGITLEQFFQFTGLNYDKLEEEYHDKAKDRVTYRLLIGAIIKEEKITVSDDEANKEAEEMAKKYQLTKDEFLKQFGGLEMIKNDLQVKKVFDMLKGNK